MRSIGVSIFVFSVLVACASADAFAQTAPEQPRVFLDTAYRARTGVTRNVPAGGNLQAAIDAANPGDLIVLQAGATYTGNFILRAKSGSTYIYIRTSAPDSALPAPGTRIDPSYASSLAKIVSPNSMPAIRTSGLANYYRLVGLELTVTPTLTLNYGVVTFGAGDATQTTTSSVPHDLIVDRCWIHGNDAGQIYRAVALNSARTSVIDSYITECHVVGGDAQGICGWNGPGPFKIANTYIEAAGENVMFGGADPKIPYLVPSDIEMRKNYLTKPLSWYRYDASFDGVGGDRTKHWTVKNAFELKNGRRVLVDGNTLEHCWVGEQAGYLVVLTPRNQGGTASWTAVQDVTFKNNVVRKAAAGVNLLGHDSPNTSQQTKRVLLQNNLFDEIGDAYWGHNGRLFQITSGTADVRIDHNTAFQTDNVITASAAANTTFAYTNNLTPHNVYGVVGSGYGVGTPTLAHYFPGCTFQRNVLEGGPSSFYPTVNYFPATMGAVCFVDMAGGNYRLAASSPYNNVGTDGRDLGADIDAIESAQSTDNP
jgi:hypothetical protein